MDINIKEIAKNKAKGIRPKKDNKFKLLTFTNIKKLKKNEIYEYILKLHKFIKKQSKKLKKYKEKWKKNKKFKIQNKGDTSPEPVVEPCCETCPVTEATTSQETTAAKPTISFVDEIKQAAESTQNQNGFVYEPTSGLYYDCKTGYYYNAEHGLYYDGNSGCYYKYNQEENKFEFHSQVYVDTENITQNDKRKTIPTSSDDSTSKNVERSRKRKKCKTNRRAKCSSMDREDGEISSESDTDESIEICKKLVVDKTECKYEDVARKYPPSLRIVVQETNLPKLKLGELFIITYKGGTLGREGVHDVIIPDINVSKYHLKFTYNSSKGHYECIDLGSRNGTLINEKRMSNAKQESEPVAVLHGTIIKLSQTKLLCHIHDGHTTCGHCEPGLVVVPETTEIESNTTLTHKEELKKIKKRYGLADEKYLIQQRTTNDRAAQRRKLVGSSDSNEKTIIASVETSIPTENKGFKMLSKLGWSQGQTLGKNQAGLLEPISLQSNEGTKGLGCEDVVISIDKKTAKKNERLKKTQERYNNAEASDIFEVNTDVD